MVRDQFFKRLAAVAAATTGSSMVDQRAGVLRASETGAAAGCGGESGGDQRGEVELTGQIHRHIAGLDGRIQLLEGLICELTAKQADSQDEPATGARSLSPAAAQGMLEVSTALQAVKHDMQNIVAELAPRGEIDSHIAGLDERIQLLEGLVCYLTAKQADLPGEYATGARSLSPAAAQGMLEVSMALQAVKHDMQNLISELKQSQAEDSSCHEGGENEAPSQQNMRQTDAEAAIASLLSRAEGIRAILPACTAPSSTDGGGRRLEMESQGQSSLVKNSASASNDMGNDKEGTAQSPDEGGGERGEGVADMARGGVADDVGGCVSQENPPSWRQHKVCLIKFRVVYDV